MIRLTRKIKLKMKRVNLRARAVQLRGIVTAFCPGITYGWSFEFNDPPAKKEPNDRVHESISQTDGAVRTAVSDISGTAYNCT